VVDAASSVQDETWRPVAVDLEINSVPFSDALGMEGSIGTGDGHPWSPAAEA
jgi:hypothetical protein